MDHFDENFMLSEMPVTSAQTCSNNTHTLTTYYQQNGRIYGTGASDTARRQSGSCSAEMPTGTLVSMKALLLSPTN